MKLLKVVALVGLAFLVGCSAKPKMNEPMPQPMEDQAPMMQNDNSNVGQVDFMSNSVIYFDFNKSDIKDDQMDKLNKQVDWLKSNKFSKIVVEGYTDIYGSREYNLALGARRANAIKDMLIQQGISASKIQVVSFGKDKLADKIDQSKNRRTITRIVK